MKIGVLGLQGAVEEHIKQITALGLEGITIKQPEQLQEIDGLILPGGESTTISRLIHRYGFTDPIKKFAKSKNRFSVLVLEWYCSPKSFQVQRIHILD